MNALLIAAAIAGVLLGAGAYAAYDTLVDDPGIVAVEQAKCTAAVEAAAAKATRDEQARQFKLGEQAFQQAYLQDQEDRAWHDAQVDALQSEIRDYEAERGAEGRACPLDDRDLDFLGVAPVAGGLRQQPH